MHASIVQAVRCEHACADMHLEAIKGTKGATEISAEAILDRGALRFEGQQFGCVCETKRERERERENRRRRLRVGGRSCAYDCP